MLPDMDTGFDALEYAFAQENVASGLACALAERTLWCAVIEQAFVDIGMVTDTRGLNKRLTVSGGRNYDAARRWLLFNGRDFPLVCSLAGVCPAVVRRAAIMFLLNDE